MFIKSVCAWCGRELTVTEYAEGKKDEWRISHSICHRCKDKFIEEARHFFSKQTQVLARN